MLDFGSHTSFLWRLCHKLAPHFQNGFRQNCLVLAEQTFQTDFTFRITSYSALDVRCISHCASDFKFSYKCKCEIVGTVPCCSFIVITFRTLKCTFSTELFLHWSRLDHKIRSVRWKEKMRRDVSGIHIIQQDCVSG